jgi:hypothetical protein
VLLLSSCNLPKLFLGISTNEALQTTEYLKDALGVESLLLRSADEGLDLEHRVLIQMVAHAIVNLGQDSLEEVGALVLAKVEDLVDVANMQQLLARQALAHDESLVGLADAESLHKTNGRIALGNQPERRKWRQQIGVWRGVDKVGKASERSGESNGRAVQGNDKNLGMGVECVGNVKIVGNKGLEVVPLKVVRLTIGRPSCIDIGSAVTLSVGIWYSILEGAHIRREEPSLSSDDCDEDGGILGDLVQQNS